MDLDVAGISSADPGRLVRLLLDSEGATDVFTMLVRAELFATAEEALLDAL